MMIKIMKTAWAELNHILHYVNLEQLFFCFVHTRMFADSWWLQHINKLLELSSSEQLLSLIFFLFTKNQHRMPAYHVFVCVNVKMVSMSEDCSLIRFQQLVMNFLLERKKYLCLDESSWKSWRSFGCSTRINDFWVSNCINLGRRLNCIELVLLNGI